MTVQYSNNSVLLQFQLFSLLPPAFIWFELSLTAEQTESWDRKVFFYFVNPRAGYNKHLILLGKFLTGLDVMLGADNISMINICYDISDKKLV